jgi:hypothetical protein
MGQSIRTGVVIFGLTLGAVFHPVQAQEQSDGPTALIITYHARPGARATLRKIMQEDGVAQLEKWKNEGVVAAYTLLFTAYAGDSSPDMFLILRFKHFSDLGGWQKIEETYPGGLTERAQAVAQVDASATADIVKEATGAPSPKDSQFLVLEYDVTAEMPKYLSYVQGYVAPQFEGWLKAGVLASYVCYVNQNPAGAPWASLIVLEYKDLKSLSAREVVKNRTREQLATSDPVWKKWSDDKSAMRKEKAAIPALSLH